MTLRNLLIGAAAAAAFAGLASAADAADTAASASINITVPNTVTKQTDLNFGSVSRPVSGADSVVTVGASSGAVASVASGGAAIVAGSTSGPASFTVTGNGSGGTVAATLDFSDDNAQFSTRTASVSASTLALTSTNGYTQTIYVGGSLGVKPTTAPKQYTGTLTLSVTFP